MTKQKLCYIPAKASSIFDEKSVGWPSEHNTHKCTGKREKTINIRLFKNPPKIREIDWSHLCLQQFDEFRKCDAMQPPETENVVNTLNLV